MKNKWMRILIGVLLGGSSALLITAAFPPYDLWPLIFVAFVPMLVAQFKIMPYAWSSLPSAIAIGGWLGLYFTDIFAPFDVSTAWYMKALPIWGGLIVFLTDKGKRKFNDATRYRWFVLYGIIDWVGFEMIRSLIPMFGTWGFVGYTLWSQPWLVQPLSWVGILGLDLLLMLINFGLALGALKLLERWGDWRDTPAVPQPLMRKWLAITGAVTVIWVAASLVMWFQPVETDTARVAAVQPNIYALLDEGEDIMVVDTARVEALTTQLEGEMIRLTREAADQGAKIVVWPEGHLSYDPQEQNTATFESLAQETDAYLVLGYAFDTDAGLRNETAVVAPHGAFLGTYGKSHPVLFAGETKSINAGEYPVFDTPYGQLASIICYDLNFTDTTRKMAQQGAQIVAVPSNDWAAIAEKQYTHLVFRAIENRVAMVKAEDAFNSAIIDPRGNVVSKAVSTTPQQALLVSDVTVADTTTLYARTGDWLGWLSLGLYVAAAFLTGKAIKAAEAEQSEETGDAR